MMEYTILETTENKTLISVIINNVVHQTLIICNDGELDSMVQLFVNSVINPPKHT